MGFGFLASPFLSGIWAPWPSEFRLQGQDPSLILALGDLQWARGPFFFSLFSSNNKFSFLYLDTFLSQGRGSGSPLPPPVASPSLPTPSWIGRMASQQEGGGGDLVPAFGCPSSNFLPQGSCIVVVFLLCGALLFDSLCVLLGPSGLTFCLVVMPFDVVFVCKNLGFLVGVRVEGVAFLSSRMSYSCCCCVVLLSGLSGNSWKGVLCWVFFLGLLALPCCVFHLLWWGWSSFFRALLCK